MNLEKKGEEDIRRGESFSLPEEGEIRTSSLYFFLAIPAGAFRQLSPVNAFAAFS